MAVDIASIDTIGMALLIELVAVKGAEIRNAAICPEDGMIEECFIM